MDFALLPPEINSTLIYAGPGSGSLLSAAATWDGLAIDLYSTSSAYQSVIETLTAGPWIGPSSAAMAAAAAPYVTWLRATAAQAEHTADQAKAAAAAFEAAFADTVPPPVVAANRMLLTTLVATNFFGQNTALIALTETQYAEMWAQDTAAMQGYASAAAAATTLTPFTGPAESTDQGGVSSQAVAVAQAANTAAGEVQSAVSNAAQALSAVPNALTALASPAAALDPTPILTILDFFGDISGIFVDPEIGAGGVVLDGILAGTALPYDLNSYYTGIHTDDIVSAWAGTPPWPPGYPGAVPSLDNPAVAAGLGEARSVGALSVPSAWTTEAPAARMAAAVLPAVQAVETSASGAGAVFSQMALAGMAGRALAGTTGSGGSAGPRVRERAGVATKLGPAAPESKEPTEPTETEATATTSTLRAGGPITSIAAELRELASLRDAGILTEAEFLQQKQRLLPH